MPFWEEVYDIHNLCNGNTVKSHEFDVLGTRGLILHYQ